jgi:asparagine synthase (glutamine-hydrolysing)
MCGIVGFNFEDPSLARKMCDVMTHRGPDGEGYYTNERITLGHRRLSIIDLQTGDQPIYNEDGTIVVVHNGEIYNFRQLRTDLESKGHHFTTGSDTEVIIHSYEEYGFDCVGLFNGMFAFAVYDSNKKILFLARDRCGIKPLHYAFLDDGTFLFASEIKAILQYKRVKREMDPQSLHFTINLRYIPGERTMFKGIRRLLPGHTLILKDKKFTTSQYWKPEFSPTLHPEEYYIKTLRKLLEDSVERHLISDVPVGILLSGGIDSSSIVALATKMTDDPIRTYCMGFGHPDDELNDARLIADHFGTDHQQVVIEDHLLRDYPKMIWYADEPKRNLYPYYISELVGKDLKVVLGGLGSDELFGGYVFKYIFAQGIEDIRRRAANEKGKIISETAGLLINFQTICGNITDDEHLNYLSMMKGIDDNASLYLITQTQDKVFNDEYLEKIYGDRTLSEKLINIRDFYYPLFNNSQPFIDQLMLADLREKMVNDFLFVDDRMNMAHSLESRVPFLDLELMNFSLTIPRAYKLKDPNGKYILKKAMQDILPKEVLCKKKQGFASGVYDIYLNEGREIMQQILPDGDLVTGGYIKKEYLDKVLDEIPNPKLNLHYGALWNLLTCEIWHRMFITTDMNRSPPPINRIF